jgi:hypothetical protein
MASFGVDIHSFVPTVWELIPYTFVLDYFANIGNILQSYSYPRSFVTWVTKWQIENKSFTVKPFDIPLTSSQLAAGWYDRQWTSSPGYRKERTISRHPYSGSLHPGFGFKIPGMSMKWLNLAALSAVKLY